MKNHVTSQNCIGPTIRIGREIHCLPYAGFFIVVSITIQLCIVEHCIKIQVHVGLYGRVTHYPVLI